MGGGHSIENIETSINTSVTNIVSKSFQSVSTKVDNSQIFTLECTEFNKTKLAAMEKCIDKFTPNTPPDICYYRDFICSVGGISMTNKMDINMSTTQEADVKTTYENNLKSNLASNIKTTHGILEFGDTTKNHITALNTAIVGILNVNIQEIITNIKNTQVFQVTGGSVQLVTMDNASNSILKCLQAKTEYTNLVTSLANDIIADTSSSSGFNFSTLYIILGSILGIVAGLLLILWLYRKLYRRNATAILVQ